jgi:hypothetical protein
MHDSGKSTSPNPSRDGAGHRAGDSSSSSRPRNAFDPEFLRERQEREDEPLAASEAESRGPWIVVEAEPPSPGAPDSGPLRRRWQVYRAWEDPETDAPTAGFRFREQAFLYAAALEVGARGSVLTLGREPREGGGYDVVQWDIQGHPEVVGRVALYDEEVFPTFQKLETLLRAIEPLAQVLEAAGGVILELLGRRLMVE